MSCTLWRSRKKKSWFWLSREISLPALILCAFTTIWLSAAWRKIWFNRTTLQNSALIISRRTFPGPTDGSWLTSPTIIRRHPGTIAFNKAFSRKISTIENSSTITTSASSGCNSFLSKCIPLLSSESTLPFNSKSRWIVCASHPVVSDILLAARPVGAAKSTSIPSSSKTCRIVLIVVVLPVPGPPVIMVTPFWTAWYTALFCNISKTIPWRFSILETLFESVSSDTENDRFRSRSIRAQFISI